MDRSFMSQHAPNLLVDDSNAGITGPDPQPQYDASGTPLPFIQNQGGGREYFGNAYDQQGMPLPYTQNQSGGRQFFGTPATGAPPVAPTAPTPTPPPQAGVDAGPGTDPNDVWAAVNGTDNQGPRAGITLPGPRQPMQDTQAAVNGGLDGPSAVAPVQDMLRGRTPYGSGPPDSRAIEQRIMNGVGTGMIDPSSPGRAGDRALRQGATLADLLSHLNFTLPSAPRSASAHQVDNGKVLRNVAPEYGTKPEPDRRLRDLGALSELPNFRSQDGLNEFNRRMGLQLGSQTRTQAEQDRLRRSGRTTATLSFHDPSLGMAADIHPREIGGLTGQRAVQEVRRRAVAAGYNVGNMQFIWEDGVHRGTGPHVHMEPTGHPRDYQTR